MLGVLSMPAAVGTLRISDALGLAVDRGFIDDAVYLRLTNTFLASAGVKFATSELSAGYAFRVVPDPQSLGPAPFHTFDLRYGYNSRRLAVTLTESIGLGQQVFLGVGRASPLVAVMATQDARAPTPPSPALTGTNTVDTSLLPAAQKLPIVIQRAEAGLGYRWDRRWSSSFALGYSSYGALTREAQQDLALQHALNSNGTLAYKLSARTDLTTGVQLSHGWNSREERFTLFILSESWQRRLTEKTRLDAGAGLSVRETGEMDGKTVLATVPVGSIGLDHTMRSRDLTGGLRLSVTFMPVVDVVSARLQNRLVSSVTASLRYDDLSTGVGFSLSQVVPTSAPYAVGYVNGNVFSAYRLTTWLGASVSAQVTRQWFGSDDERMAAYAASGLTWGVYGGLDATFSVQRF